MRKKPQEQGLSAMDTHDLWVWSFRLRHEIVAQLEDLSVRNAVFADLALLGSVLGELRSRGLQGRLDV
jgi:hypothetical protein